MLQYWLQVVLYGIFGLNLELVAVANMFYLIGIPVTHLFQYLMNLIET